MTNLASWLAILTVGGPTHPMPSTLAYLCKLNA